MDMFSILHSVISYIYSRMLKKRKDFEVLVVINRTRDGINRFLV